MQKKKKYHKKNKISFRCLFFYPNFGIKRVYQEKENKRNAEKVISEKIKKKKKEKVKIVRRKKMSFQISRVS